MKIAGNCSAQQLLPTVTSTTTSVAEIGNNNNVYSAITILFATLTFPHVLKHTTNTSLWNYLQCQWKRRNKTNFRKEICPINRSVYSQPQLRTKQTISWLVPETLRGSYKDICQFVVSPAKFSWLKKKKSWAYVVQLCVKVA